MLALAWLDPLHGAGYQFWSGIAGCAGVLGVLWAYLRRHNCHVKGCWRIARQQVRGTTYVTCRRHHPHGKPSVERVHAAHREAEDRRRAG